MKDDKVLLTANSQVPICLYITVSAAATIANIVKSSLGPVGLDKMLVDDVGVRSAIVNYSKRITIFSYLIRYFFR